MPPYPYCNMRTNPCSHSLRYRLFALLAAACGLAVSAQAATVPSVTSGLQSQTVTGGASVTFTVTASGTTPLYYQWLFNGTPLAGATAANLALTNVQLPDAGNYSIIVTNTAGGTTGLVATLTVTNGQVTRNVALGKPVILNGTFGSSATMTNTVTDGAFLTSGTQWQSGTVWWNGPAPAVEVDLQGSYLINAVVVQADDNDSYLLECKTNATAPRVLVYLVPNASGGGMRTRPNMGNNAERYTLPTPLPAAYLRLEAYAGDNSYSVSEIQAYATFLQPLLTQQPASATVTVGNTAQFSAAATGTPPLAYRWQFNGTDILNATNGTFSFQPTDTSSSGGYRVIVTNTWGAVTSAVATLTVSNALCAVPPSGLVAWWRAEGGANDPVGGNNGTLQNGATFAPGRVGQAFEFNAAASASVRIPNSPALNPTNITISAWVKPASYPNGACTIVRKENSSGQHYLLSLGDGATFGVPHFNCGVGSSQPVGSTPVPLNQWTHVVGTYDGVQSVVYMNGVLADARSCSGPMSQGPNDLFLGHMENAADRDFDGLMDEVAIWPRALTSSEVAALYAAGSAGMCFDLPVITQQPVSTNFLTGGTAVFNVTATSALPFGYAWQLNGTNLPGATAATLTLANAQPGQSGSYRVIVSNAAGSVTSLVATLTVTNLVCAPPPLGITAWWPGDGNAGDVIGGNNGSLVGQVSFGAGVVGQAFQFNGNGRYAVPESPSLRFGHESFTLQFWVKPASFAGASDPGSGIRLLDKARTYPSTWWVVDLLPGGAVEMEMADANSVSGTTHSDGVLPLNLWTHVAIVVDRQNFRTKYYLNGQPDSSKSFSPAFTGHLDVAGSGLYIGSDFNAFKGGLDEFSVCRRALNDAEIAAVFAAGSAGMCAASVPATLLSQPSSQVAMLGETVSFAVTASGGYPLGFQWRFNGATLTGSTNATLTVSNAQPSQAGNYDVVVANLSGSVTSAVAVLTVIMPPEQRALFVNVVGGSYDGDGQNFYQTLLQAGAVGTFVNLDVNGKVAAVLAANEFDEIWVFDLSAGADNYPADWLAIGDWFNARTNQTLICDGRSISSYWSGRWQNEGKLLTENYYMNLRWNGGGLVLATDHSAYQTGINSINDRIGIQPFYGDFYLGSIPVDTNSPLMVFPNNMGPVLFDDSSPGQAPFGLQPNGLILYSVGWHSGNTNTPGISTTIRGGVGFRVQIASPLAGSQFNEKAAINFQAQPVAGSAPFIFTWRSDRDGALGSGQALQVSTLSPGTHRITLVGTDGLGAADSLSVQITVIGLPDLVATDLTAPASAQAGQLISPVWTLTNQGSIATTNAWNVQLALATTSAGSGAVSLGTFRVTNALPAAGSLTQTGLVILAAGITGPRWLMVTVDSSSEVVESVETNNVFVAAPSLTLLCPDLEESLLTSAPTAFFGEPFAVTWAVTNIGNGPTLGAWSDRLWLSSASNSLSGAMLLTTAPASLTPLAAAAGYSNGATITIPLTAQSLPGGFWLVAQTDSANAVSESNEGNNLRSIPLALALPPLPDLSAANVSAPPSAASGASMEVVWAVTNLGPAGVTSVAWSEAVYLVPSDGSDWSNPSNLTALSPLKILTLTNTLAAGDFLLRTQAVTVPLASPVGATRFVVLVDSANQVVEASEANNIALATNTTAIPAVLTLQLPVSQLSEGAAAVKGTLTRNGPTTSPLDVTVTNDRPGEISFSLVSPISGITVRIPAGASFAQVDVRALTDGVVDGPQLVTISAAATGFPAVTGTLTVLDVDVPRLWLSLNPTALIEGGSVTGTVTRELVSGSALVVPLAGSGSSRLIVPLSVTIPAGAASADFMVSAGENFVVEGPRACTVLAQATGYQSVSAPLTLLDNDLPVVTLTFTRTNLSEGDGAQAAQVTITRAPVTSEAVYLELLNDNPGAVSVPQFVGVAAGQSDGHFYVGAINNDVTNAPQLAVLTPVILDSVNGARLATNPPITLTVNDDDGPALRVTIPRKAAPEGSTNVATIWRNTGTNGALVVNLVSSDLTEATVPPTVTIPDGQSSVNVTIQTLSDGVADGNQPVTVSASAAGYSGSSDFFVVSDMTLPDLTVALTTVPASADSESYVQVGYHIANEGVAPASGNWTVKLFLARNPAATYEVLLDTYTFIGSLPFAAPMNFFERTVSVRMPRETGNWYVVAVVDADSVVTELLENNNVAIAAQPIQVRAAYSAAVAVVPPKTLLAGTPVILTGQAVLRDGVTPAGNVLVNIHIMRGDTNGLRRVISALTAPNGTFGTQLQPLPGEAGLYVVGAAHPGETTAPAQDTFRWLAMQAQPGGVALRLTEGGSAGGTIALQNLSGVPLTGLSVSVVGASANLTLTPTLSDVTVPASGSLSVGYGVTAHNTSVHRASATLHFTTTEGVTVDLPFYITVDALVPQLVATPGELVRGVLRGQQALVEFDVVNNGGTNTGPITVSLPSLGWISLVTTNPQPSLPPNGASTNHVTLLLSPPLDAVLSEFTGSLALNCANGGAGLAVPYRFRTLSDNRAPVLVFAEDEYTFYAEGSPLVAGANVELADALSGTAVTNGVTGADGIFNAGLLPEGYYTLTVSATNHTDDRETVLIVAGKTNELHAFISRQAVHYVWTVVPTEIEDRTRITIETVFETKVPMPVITVVPALIDLSGFGPATQIDMMVTNAGLVAGFNTTLAFDDHPVWQVTPLVGNLGTVAANSGVVVPVMITRKPGATPDCHTPCTFFGRAAWTLVSAGRTFGYNAPITFINAWTNCVCSGTPGGSPSTPPGSGSWIGSWGSGPGTSGLTIPVNNPPPVFTPPPRCVPHLDGVCAKVKLQLNQEAVLSRDAFKATLELENGTVVGLSNVLVELEIRDASGLIVPTNLFGVHDPILTALSAVDGTGIVNAQTTGKAEWIIVPSVDAAPETNLNYTVGGTLTYLDNGTPVTVPLAATRITVHPLPQLKLDYFHQRDVFADDPWTPVVEPMIPYNLAVMIQNTGHGVAKQMRIVSAQPQIVENESGLFIDFKIISTEVAGQNMVPSLTAEFGDIPAGGIKIGRWVLTSTLHGQFTSYAASFQHLDGLGNTRLAIITNVAIHEMIHLVQAPGKYEDGMPDFLVNEVDDPPLDLPDTVYLSDGTKAPVTLVPAGTIVGTLGPGNHSVILNAALPTGFVYLRIPDPGNGNYVLTKVVRSDGQEIYFGTNVWTTDRTFGDPLERPTRENMLHLFDADSTGSYTLFYNAVAAADVLAPISRVQPLPPVSFPTIPLNWTGDDEVGGSGLAFFNIFVSDNGGPFSPWLHHTALRSALFEGAPGHAYAFYSVATDAAGNAEPAPAAPQAQTLANLVNSPPVFGALAPQTINEGATLSVDLPVTDPESDTLSFAFLGTPPTGMTISPTTGHLTWPTGEATGPSTNIVSIVVTDNGSPSLSVTGAVTVVVNEVNQAPTLAPIASRTISSAMTLLITNAASDTDIPANALTFTLAADAPLGAAVDPLSGVFSWHPGAGQSPSTNPIAVIVTDNGLPLLSATQTFTIIVTNANLPPTATNYVAGTLRNTATTLALAKILKFASDPDHDTLSVSAAGPSSVHDGRITLGATTLTYLPPTNYSGADSFTYTVSDGHGGTASAQVLVSVREFDSSANKLGLTALADGWRLTFAGVSGRSYRVQRSATANGEWSTATTIVMPASGVASYDDHNPPPGTGFYRAVTP